MRDGASEATGDAPIPRPRTALGIAAAGLAACAALVAVSPHDKLTDPLTMALALCVVLSSVVSLEIEGSIFWGGAAIPHVCAFALLGPAPAAMITALEEVSVWTVDRYRLRMFPINLFGTLAPNAIAAAVMQEAPGSDLGYYVVLVVVACSAITLNLLLVTALVGLFYGEPVIERLRRHLRLLSPLALNIAVATSAVALYRAVGFWAITSVLTGVLIFAYVVRRLRIERDSSARIVELAASRGRLVGQLLEAEDRERRAVAQMLHDEVVQVLLVARQDLRDSSGPKNDVEHPIDLLDQAVEQLRGTIRATHPSILERVGLATALTAIAELHATRAPFRVEVEADGVEAGPSARLVFSAVRELLTNAAKHSRATVVSVRVTEDAGWLVVRVSDDGAGFAVDPAFSGTREGHVGLASLVDRSEAVGGGLEVVSRPDVDGTVVTLRIPQRGYDRTDHELIPGPRNDRLASVGQH